jgi:hypothetical protein
MNFSKDLSKTSVLWRASFMLLSLFVLSGVQLLVSPSAHAQSQNGINNAACPPTSQGRPCQPRPVPVPALGVGLIGLGLGLARKRKTISSEGA